MSEGPDRGEQTASDEEVALLVCLRRGEPAAVRAFTRRFYLLLLDQARRLEIQRSDRDAVVTSFLTDIMMKLARMRAPGSLSSFVVTSFRNSVTDSRRAQNLRDHFDLDQSQTAGGETVVAVACSEYVLRAVLGPGDDAEPAHAPATDLINRLLCTCTPEERQLLVWTSRRVPMREIARWLGLSYDATKQRASRLRARLARDAIALLPDLSSDDRVAMTRLLARIGVKTPNGHNHGGAAA